MKKEPLFLRRFLILLTIILFGFTACQQKHAKPAPKESSSNKPPKSIEEIQDLSEEILQEVSKQEWQTSSDKIKTMHSQWSKFYPEGQKAGLSADLVAAFNKDLNTLTTMVVSKAMEASKDDIDKEYEKIVKEQELKMAAAQQSGQGGGQEGEQKKEQSDEIKLPSDAVPDNYPELTASPDELAVSRAAVELTKHIPGFLMLYESELPPEVLKIKYNVRSIKISSKLKAWEDADAHLKQLKEVWTTVQPKIIKKKEEMGVQFNQTILELEEVVTIKDPTLSTVKADIALENIQEMTKLFE